MEKKCFRCKKIKLISDFYKHLGMADGHLNKCKKCSKRDVTMNRLNNIEHYREFDKKRSNLPHRIAARKIYSQSENGKLSHQKACEKYNKKHMNKRYAHVAVGNAIQYGWIKKECCSNCQSNEKVEAHHKDYSKPLDVTWLCLKCHKNIHKLKQPPSLAASG